MNKQIAQLQDLVRSRGAPGGRHIQSHSNTIVVSLQVFYQVFVPSAVMMKLKVYGQQTGTSTVHLNNASLFQFVIMFVFTV